jgi:hypothetical protein
VCVRATGAQRACRHSLQIGMLLHQQESFENGAGCFEDFFVDHVEQVVRVLEAFIDRLGSWSGGGDMAAPMFSSRMVLIWVTSFAVR